MANPWTMYNRETHELRQHTRPFKVRKPVSSMHHERVWEAMAYQHVFSNHETAVLTHAASFLQWNTNILVDREGQYLTVARFAELTDVDAHNLRKVMRALQRKNVLGYWNTYWVINPALYSKGRVDPRVRAWFESRVEAALISGGHRTYSEGHRLSIVR